jgi:quercetin dioxygenase-like cupin family protein
MKVLIISIAKGSRWTEHKTAARITIQTLRGAIRVRTIAQTFDLTDQRLLAVESNVSHGVEALEDSSFLLTVAKPSMPPADHLDK